jgi:RNA-directed DNA polymerase
VLNVDLENFFPSVNFGRVIGLFKSKPYGLPENVAMLLADIVCCDNYLPQGAPTSPVVTNMICRGLDDNLMQLAKRYKCFYTRYADDITFSTSGRFISKSFVLDLKSVIREEGFKINEKKFRIQNRLQRQEVTGLVVNEKLNVNRKYIRKVRAILNNWERNGVLAASKQYFRKFDRHRNDGVPNFIFSVKGKIDFIGMIRGYDDEIYKKMAKKWKSLRLIGFKF